MSGVAEQMELDTATCDLGACRICTGCAHSNHGACRGLVRCPTDHVARTCTCCGGSR